MTYHRLFALAAALGVALLAGHSWAQPADAPEPPAEATPTTPPPQDERVIQAIVPEPPKVSEEGAGEPARAPRRTYSGIRREAVVSIGKAVEIRADESAETVVVIGGSAKIDGGVEAGVVVVGGDVEINGEVGDAVVAVLGNVTVGENARIDGDLVSVGGLINRLPGAQITGQLQQIDFGGIGLPEVEWLRAYLVHCILKLRPVAPQVGWTWAVAGVICLLYVLIAVLFPRPVQACVEEVTKRPATTLLLGILTKILTPVVILILAATGFGLVVVPFLLAGLLLFAVVGKIALLQALGLQLGRQMRVGFLQNPFPALLAGILVLLVLYIIPVVGLLVFLGTSLWGLGCAVGAAFSGIRRELPPPRRRAPLLPTPPVPGPANSPIEPATAAGVSAAALLAAAPGEGTEDPVGIVPAPMNAGAEPASPPPMPEILAYARAGFWERIGAGFLDMVLVLLASSLVGGAPLGFLVALAYFAGMWAWRQTTVGGIVLGLKVVREDGQDLSFPVALVRSLFAGFSILVLLLGFFWIAWDREKQGWHDKIAGTVVVKLPRNVPLICI